MDRTTPAPPALWLDHVSVTVPSLPEAVDELAAHLGLTATITPEDPTRHSRVMLDRTYLEVAQDQDAVPWSMPLFFFGFDDPAALKAHLDDTGVGYAWGTYEASDGTWDDIELHERDVPLPLLVRRTAPAHIAHHWPPPLVTPHRSHATALDEVHLALPDPPAARDLYRRLLGNAANQVILHEAPTSGIVGIVLGCPSLDHTLAELGEALASPDTDGIAWATALSAVGPRIGFAERRVS